MGFAQEILNFLMIFIAFIIAFTFHEFSHAFVAHILGDDTPKNFGRLTLNPLAHVDTIGLIFLLLFKFGWGKPVPMNPNNFKYPRFFEIIASLAGPVSNLLLALIFMYILKYLTGVLSVTLILLFQVIIQISVMLGVFNLLPIPPLDGGHIISVFVPEDWKESYYRYQPVVLLILFGLFFIFPQIQKFLWQLIEFVYNMLSKLVV